MLNELKCRIMEQYGIESRIYEGACQEYLCFDINNYWVTVYDDMCDYYTVELEEIVEWNQLMYKTCFSFDHMFKIVENIIRQF